MELIALLDCIQNFKNEILKNRKFPLVGDGPSEKIEYESYFMTHLKKIKLEQKIGGWRKESLVEYLII